MAARPAEKWADRAFLALAHSAMDLPPGMRSSRGQGMQGIAQLAHLVGGIRFPELEPLLDELMACIQVVPDPSKPQLVRALTDNGMEGDDIEEVATRHYLRSEVVDLHVGFFLPAQILNLIALGSTMTEVHATSESTSTSRRRSR